ncbi:membrane protein [gut metagenome]|uniref:Membrane protein n=1 Tax=gut metagenome TaxID=749906 RepID=J9FR80_9ZZZZ
MEYRQCTFLIVFQPVIASIITTIGCMGKNLTPSRIKNLLARYLERHFCSLPDNGSRRKLTVWIEDCNKPTRNQVIDIHLHIRQCRSRNTSRDDGMVVSHLGRIEHFFAFPQLSTTQGLQQIAISSGNTIEDVFTLGIDIVTQIGSIHARIGSHLLFVETLDQLQGLVCGITEFFVTFHLQGCQVEKSWRCLRSIFLGDTLNFKERIFDFLQSSAPFFFRSKPSFGQGIIYLLFLSLLLTLRHFVSIGILHNGGKYSFPIVRSQNPIGLRYKVFDLLLPAHNKG